MSSQAEPKAARALPRRRESAKTSTKRGPLGKSGGPLAHPAVSRSALSRRETDEVAGVTLTNPDRLLYSEQGLTKRDLANYYAAVADWILPHISGRPLSLVRCPEGREKGCFYQKHVGESVHPSVGKVLIEEESGESRLYPMVDSLTGLISLVQMGVLEIHPWGSKADHLEYPDRIVFDLDPGEGVSFDRVVDAAHFVRRRLRQLQLECWPKTSGGKGLHLVVPVKPQHGWNEVHEFARGVARLCTEESPEVFTENSRKAARKERIFIDYLRNARGATTVAPYSTRARAGAPVSVPLRWDEVDPDLRPESLHVGTVARRLARSRQDPWNEMDEVEQVLPASIREVKAPIPRSMWER